MMDEATRDVLLRARELIAKEGWRQGILIGPGRCIIVACSDVAVRPPRDDPRYPYPDVTPATDILCELVGVRSISAWNDAPGRTVEEVLALFDRALAQ